MFTHKPIAQAPTKTFILKDFRGLDYSHAETEIDVRRSPDSLNTIAGDVLGEIVKRPADIIVYHNTDMDNGEDFTANVTWVQQYKADYGSTGSIIPYNKVLYAIAYEYNVGPYTYIYSADISNGELINKHFEYQIKHYAINKINSFMCDGKLYILTGVEYLTYNPINGITKVINNPYIPVIEIHCDPTTGAGKYYPYGLNILTDSRKKTYSTISSVLVYYVDKSCQNVTSVMYNDGTGYVELFGASSGHIATYDNVTKQVSISGSMGSMVNSENDNLEITWDTQITIDTSIIENCTFYAMYGLGNDTRYFFSGNPTYPNMDWNSGLEDPTYFPQTGYTKIGNADNPIMGYFKSNGQLIVIKKTNIYDNTIYIRNASLQDVTYEDGTTDKNTPVFSVVEGIKGIGAISKGVFNTILDKPIFLSDLGVKSVISNAITQVRSLQDKSQLIDPVLASNTTLMTNAFAITLHNFLYLCIGNDIYVADGRQESADGYEWYRWTDFIDTPTSFAIVDNELWFTTAHSICKFKMLETTSDKWNENDNPISAYWKIPKLTFGNFLIMKNIKKKGIGLLMMQHEKSSVQVYYKRNSEDEIDVGNFVYDGNGLDSQASIPINLGKNINDVVLFQMKIENNQLNEDLGLIAIEISYEVKGYSRGVVE